MSDTPRVDVHQIYDPLDMDAAPTAYVLESDYRQLERELAEAKAWKESAMRVLPPLQEIAKELNLPLGLSIHDRILPAIQKLRAELAEARKDASRWVRWCQNSGTDKSYHDAAMDASRMEGKP